MRGSRGIRKNVHVKRRLVGDYPQLDTGPDSGDVDHDRPVGESRPKPLQTVGKQSQRGFIAWPLALALALVGGIAVHLWNDRDVRIGTVKRIEGSVGNAAGLAENDCAESHRLMMARLEYGFIIDAHYKKRFYTPFDLSLESFSDFFRRYDYRLSIIDRFIREKQVAGSTIGVGRALRNIAQLCLVFLHFQNTVNFQCGPNSDIPRYRVTDILQQDIDPHRCPVSVLVENERRFYRDIRGYPRTFRKFQLFLSQAYKRMGQDRIPDSDAHGSQFDQDASFLAPLENALEPCLWFVGWLFLTLIGLFEVEEDAAFQTTNLAAFTAFGVGLLLLVVGQVCLWRFFVVVG